MTDPAAFDIFPDLHYHGALQRYRSRSDPERVARGMILIGEWVRQGRNRARFSQAQLARMAGIHQSTLSRLENGKLEGLALYKLAAIIGALQGALRPPPI